MSAPGAPAISWPHHKGESLSLTIRSARLCRGTVKVVAGRVPVTIHVSALAVEDTMALARHARRSARRHPRHHALFLDGRTREAIHDYFIRLCTSIELPVLSTTRRAISPASRSPAILMSRLIERLPNSSASRRRASTAKSSWRSRAWRSRCGEFRAAHRSSFLLPSGALGASAPIRRGLGLPEPVRRAVRRLHGW